MDVKLVGSCDPELREQLIKEYGVRGEYLYHTYGSLSESINKEDENIILDTITEE